MGGFFIVFFLYRAESGTNSKLYKIEEKTLINLVNFPQVDVNDYMVRCRAAYCTSLEAASEIEAQKSVCNVLSAYHKVCTAITGKAVLWRSASLCRK